MHMNEHPTLDHQVPKDHPRHESLNIRHKIVEGMKNLVVAEAGLIAHGRGECFDYILGETTTPLAKRAIEAAIAMLLTANSPIISVNGNTAALCPHDLVNLSKAVKAPLEINLFYGKPGRVEAIEKTLRDAGADRIYGTDPRNTIQIEELSSNRRNIDKRGIMISDVVLVPLEDGDRTEALKKLGKKVIAIDLNPLSRTAIYADITIIDNVVRTIPEMVLACNKVQNYSKEQLINIVRSFDNKKNIQDTLDLIINYVNAQKTHAFDILKD
jgi:4-phosphopantoate--beta-alanine ligase